MNILVRPPMYLLDEPADPVKFAQLCREIRELALEILGHEMVTDIVDLKHP